MPIRQQQFIYWFYDKTKQILMKLLEDKISRREADRFFDGSRAFYKAAYEYCTNL